MCLHSIKGEMSCTLGGVFKNRIGFRKCSEDEVLFWDDLWVGDKPIRY